MRNTAHTAPSGVVSEAAGREAAAGSAMQRFREIYTRVLEVLVGGLMVIMATEVTIGVVFRTMGNSLIWYDEVASILLAWLTFYGSALASAKRAHISCPELVDLLPPGGRRAANIVAQLLVIAFFGLVAWIGASIMPLLAGDSLVSLPNIPVTFVQSVIPVSAILILIAEIMYLIDLVTGKDVKSGSH
jgi:TRAP-type C4-dicarboxylate transport system permease small subunit